MAAGSGKKFEGDVQGWSRGGLEKVPNCPACGKLENAPVTYERHDDGSIMPDIWRMVRCASCGSLYLNPRPDEESLPRAYEDYYTHQAESKDIPDSGASGLMWSMVNGYLNRRFGMSRQPCNRVGFALFSLIEPWRLKLDYYGRHLAQSAFPQRGRLLDVGCGNGAFLLNAQDMGWQSVGCEPDLKAVKTCRELGLNVCDGDAFSADLDDKTFDVITLSHVIEHVQDPVALLARVHALLNPGGLVWLALPNPASLGLRAYGTAWHGLHMPYHLCVPSQQVLMSWLDDIGFVSSRLIRRGTHARNQWGHSRRIRQREKLSGPSIVVHTLTRVASSLLATVSPRWGEETVLVARKKVGHDGV